MERLIKATVLEFSIALATDERLFSPKAVDSGTLAMLAKALPYLSHGQKILDLGCGYGVVGITCAHLAGEENIYMLDKDALAVAYAKKNAALNHFAQLKIIQSDGFSQLEETAFDCILCNPPYHSDFKIPRLFIEKGFNRLAINGRMFMVTKRREWYKQKFIHIFGGVRIDEIDGYYVFEAIKTDSVYASKRR